MIDIEYFKNRDCYILFDYGNIVKTFSPDEAKKLYHDLGIALQAQDYQERGIDNL